MAKPIDDLIARLITHPEKVLVIIGSGVTVATTKNAEVATWTGLLKHGIRYCIDQLNASEEWGNLRETQLAFGEFVQVASEVSKKLGAPSSGNFAGWLQQTLGRFEVSDPRLIKAIATWGSPIATTNYDGLISQITGLDPITWQDRAWLAEFVSGEIKKVLHLHGIYLNPTTVVLGAESYESVVRDRTIQDVMKALVIGKTSVFVGCGAAGLSDPNIGSLITWYRDVLHDTIRPSYLLVSEPERDGWLRQLEDSQIRLINYGATYDQLPVFLENITERLTRERRQVGPLETLTSAQVSFDQSVAELFSRTETIGSAETIRQLMELVRSHWHAGGRRSAWRAAASLFQRLGTALQAEEQTRFGLELADMMYVDGVPDRALEILRQIQTYVESGEIGLGQRHLYWELQSRCLQAFGPYVDTGIALKQAIKSATDDRTRSRLKAELAEVRFLQGEISEPIDHQEADKS